MKFTSRTLRLNSLPAQPSLALLPASDGRFVSAGFAALLPVLPGTEDHLRRVLRDALDHPGSMARAQLAFDILRSRGAGRRHARALAVAMEYFHTASLIFDDLPSMDNALIRRGRPCPHIQYGEAAAQLGALAIITRAYALLWDVFSTLPPARRNRAARLVESCLGMAGMLDGQSRDLHFHEQVRDADEVQSVARGKTVSLIRLTLLLPALVAGARKPVLMAFDDLADSWGMAYQILDDFKDCSLANTDAGKTGGRDRLLGRPNYVIAVGPEAARKELDVQLDRSRALLRRLVAMGWRVRSLQRLQDALDAEAARVELKVAVPA